MANNQHDNRWLSTDYLITCPSVMKKINKTGINYEL